MYPHQAERLGAELERHRLDALVASSPANVAYVSGFSSLARRVYPTQETYAVVTREATALVVPTIDVLAVLESDVDVNHLACHGRFHWFAFGISRELFRANMSQAVENPRRAPDGVFVEVEAEPIPPSERRVVRRQRADGFAWAKHCYTSHVQNEHAHAILQSPPNIRLFSRSDAIRAKKVAAL